MATLLARKGACEAGFPLELREGVRQLQIALASLQLASLAIQLREGDETMKAAVKRKFRESCDLWLCNYTWNWLFCGLLPDLVPGLPNRREYHQDLSQIQPVRC